MSSRFLLESGSLLLQEDGTSDLLLENSTSTFTVTPSGGLVLGGGATPGIAWSPAPSGGPILGGTATPGLTVSPAPSGGLVLGGVATAAAAFAPAPSGTLTLGGAATTGNSSSFSYAPAGGLALGGSATPSAGFSITPSGGLILYSPINPVGMGVSYAYAPSGGLVLGGAATTGGSSSFSVAPSGGLTLGGASIVVFVGAGQPVAEDLLSALQIAFGTLGLAASITGGLFTSAASDGGVPPYAVVEESGSFEELRTSTSVVHQVTLRWRVYGPTLETAGRLADTLVGAFAGQGFSWSGPTGDASSSALLIRTEPRHQRGTARTRGGQDCWWHEREMYCRVRRLTL